MDVDVLREVVDAHHIVVVVVRLLGAPVLEGDAAVESNGHALHGRTLHLAFDALRVCRETAIDGHMNFRHMYRAVVVDLHMDD